MPLGTSACSGRAVSAVRTVTRLVRQAADALEVPIPSAEARASKREVPNAYRRKPADRADGGLAARRAGPSLRRLPARPGRRRRERYAASMARLPPSPDAWRLGAGAGMWPPAHGAPGTHPAAGLAGPNAAGFARAR
nr:hypothetical protein GCM10010200_043550 [Actinomadura rugatobispora]